jgi:hypothetical protein
VTRFRWTSIRLAAIYVLPLLVFYPLYAYATNTPLELRPNWAWFALSVVLINGLVEETMMRGYVFRHLREGRGFWHAATLATIYFAAYRLPHRLHVRAGQQYHLGTCTASRGQQWAGVYLRLFARDTADCQLALLGNRHPDVHLHAGVGSVSEQLRAEASADVPASGQPCIRSALVETMPVKQKQPTRAVFVCYWWT